MSSNKIKDLTPISNLKNLKTLNLKNNQINEIPSFVNTPGLLHLYLSGNQISEVQPLLENDLRQDDLLINIEDNPLSEKAINEDIPALEKKRIWFKYE